MKITARMMVFLMDYRAWATGKPDVIEYDRTRGLCANAIIFDNYRHNRGIDGDHKPTFHELLRLLDHYLGEKSYPFGYGDYDRRRRQGTQHMCLERLAFVDKMLRLPQ